MNFIWTRSLVLIGAAATVVSAQVNQCYWRGDAAIHPESSPGWFACNNTQVTTGGAQLCCLGGSQCGEDSLCRQPSSSGGYNWFVGGCTDPNYKDPVCRMDCTNDAQTWITWNTTTDLWQCCGSNGCDGSPPTASFSAVSPNQFSAVPSYITSTTPTASATSTTFTGTSSNSQSTSTATSGASSDSTSQSGKSSSGLSTGAIAGIAVAGGIIALAITGAIVFFCLRKSLRKRQEAPPAEPQYDYKWQQGQQPPNAPKHLSQYTVPPYQSSASSPGFYDSRSAGSAEPMRSSGIGTKYSDNPPVHELASEQRAELGGGGSPLKTR